MLEDRLRLSIQLLAALVALLCGCSDSASQSSLPTAVQCKLFWRASTTVGPGESPMDPKFQLQERALRVGRGEQASAAIADIKLDVHYFSDAFEGSSVSVAAAFDGKPSVSWLYQLTSDPLPRNQFAGGHGFTGLVYLVHPTKAGAYQFLCEFSDTSPLFK